MKKYSFQLQNINVFLFYLIMYKTFYGLNIGWWHGVVPMHRNNFVLLYGFCYGLYHYFNKYHVYEVNNKSLSKVWHLEPPQQLILRYLTFHLSPKPVSDINLKSLKINILMLINTLLLQARWAWTNWPFIHSQPLKPSFPRHSHSAHKSPVQKYLLINLFLIYEK